MYAPPFRPGRRATSGRTRSAGRRCGAGRCARRRRRCACAGVCADVWACACAGTHVCRGIAARTKVGIYVCMYVYICIYMYVCICMQYSYIYTYMSACVGGGYGRACGLNRRALFVAPSIDGTRTDIVHRFRVHACIYIHARLAARTNGSPMRVRRTCCVGVCARVRLGAHTPAPTDASAFCSVDRGWLGSQAFNQATASNANIGAWNTASVTTLSYVCAAFPARRRATAAGRARRVFDAAQAVMLRRVGTRMRGCPRV
jgi:hypothetical protein